MVQIYAFDEELHALGSPGFVGHAARFHAQKFHPRCMCNGQGIEVYIARRHDQYVIHRMPNTGPAHTPDCDHFEPDEDLTGLGALVGHAIIDDQDTGLTSLKLGFPLSRGSSRLASEAMAVEKSEVGADGARMTLRGFLHYLWNDAHLTHWHPKMAGKRSWNVVRNALRGSLVSKDSKGQHLGALVYVPEIFSVQDKYEIEQRRNELVARALPATKQSMILIAEVKSIEKSLHGEKIICKHLPDWPLFLDAEMAGRVHRNFEAEIASLDSYREGHLVVCATFELDRAERAIARFITFMPTNEHWIPFENREERSLVARCIEARRRFIKGMRMNYASTRPIANVILIDTKPLGTALYLRRRSMTGDYQAVLAELMSKSGVIHLEVDLAQNLPVPG